VTTAQTKKIENEFKGLESRISGIMGGIGGKVTGIFTGLLAGVSVRQIGKFADEFTKVQNALKTTGLSGQDLTNVYNALFEAAQRQGAPLESMATLYSKISLAQKDLGVSGGEMIRFTEGIGLALRVQGTSATEASGALLQLGQALSNGKVQAEEYNSLLDGGQAILKAVASGLKEADGSVSKLTSMVKAGEVSSRAFFKAFEAGRPVLDEMARASVPTLAQGLERVQNALVQAAGKMDEAAGASSAFQSALNFLVADIEKMPAGLESTVRELERIIDLFQRLDGAAAAAFTTVRQSSSQALSQVQGEISGLRSAIDEARQTHNTVVIGDIEKRLKDAENRRDALAESVREANRALGLGGGAATNPTTPAPKTTQVDPDRMTRPINQISTADYPVAPKAGGSGGGGKSSAQKVSEYQQEIQAIEERTRALQNESLTIGKSEFEIAKSEAAFRLLEAAKKDNVAITPQLTADIDAVASAYAEASQKIEAAEKALRDSQRAMREFQNIATDAVSGFVSDLRQGKSAAESFQSAIDRVVDSLLDMALKMAMNAISNSLGPSLGIPARASGGPVQSGKTYLVGENGPELVRFGKNGTVVPNGLIGKGGGGGGSVQVNIVNNSGAQVTQQKSQTPGGMRLDVMIDEMAAQKIATPGSASNRALRAGFGLRPGLTRR
jgi:tape measure domain-containing protein